MNLELVTNMMQRHAPDYVIEQVNFWIALAQEAIRMDERERIQAELDAKGAA